MQEEFALFQACILYYFPKQRRNIRMMLCCLCLCSFDNNYKELISANGACNVAYNIASKYFDPMLLLSDQEHKSAIVCSVCWEHIQDFYDFQQTVYKAHSNLEDVKGSVSMVKIEEECVDDMLSKSREDYLDKELKNEKDQSVIATCGLDEDNTFSSEDERPLMEKFKTERITIKPNIMEKILSQRNRGNIRSRKKSKAVDPLLKSPFASESHMIDMDGTTYDISDKPDAHLKTLENDAFIAAWRSELDCAKCNEKFTDFTLLRKHFLKNHSNEKCYIVCCDRKFRSRYHIVEHIKLHVNPNVYRCEICGKCSTNSRNLAKHKKELHSEEGKQRSLECPTCLKILANKNSLRVHMEIHETSLIYSCRECGKGFPSEQKRTLHERYVHNATLVCDQCGKKLHNQYSMRQHLLRHAGVQKRKWPCDMCNAELTSHSSLKRHKQLIHQDRTTVYICSDCGKVTTTEIALRTHKRNVHISGRKHKCTLCDKAFKFPRVLREHVATHTGEDLYHCPHCERTFKTNANMHHHRKKAHPKEWTEGRLNRPQVTKVDFNSVQKEVVI